MRLMFGVLIGFVIAQPPVFNVLAAFVKQVAVTYGV